MSFSAQESKLHREAVLTRCSIGFTLVAAAAFAAVFILDLFALGAFVLVESVAFLVFASFLIYGSLVYQVARLGHLHRRLACQPASPEQLRRILDHASPPAVTVLVPSYREDSDVVRQTLLSAALQDYPDRRVVLLIDDPPDPGDIEARRQLLEARALPGEIEELLAPARARFEAALQDFLGRRHVSVSPARRELARLAGLFADAASWFEREMQRHVVKDHTDQLFSERVLGRRRDEYAGVAEELRGRATGEGGATAEELEQLYRRLARLFRVTLTSFERKRYANLSHAPNKAMNLNSYIGLLGGRFAEVEDGADLRLERAQDVTKGIEVPYADYVLTLDADSLLLPDYTVRLVHLMEEAGNERVGVAQTPYSAVPAADRAIERIAGATTDIQYIIHQGFTRHGATFWVGANALLRKAALDDIVEDACEPGVETRRYIQDRTVIEDTESSVDLVDRGWRLVNYPARLSYSATPPDFGSLVVQRQRWANGGLIILPKLLRYLVRRPWSRGKLGEAFMRVHYLVSIAAISTALIFLIAYPFTDHRATFILPLTAACYFWLYSRDLAGVGYRSTDVFRVYALNLMLVPVNLSGVAKSLYQGASGRRIAFKRTPKIKGRTAAAPLYILSTYALLAWVAYSLAWDVATGEWRHAAFLTVTLLLLAYAITRFIGWQQSAEEVSEQLKQRLASGAATALGRCVRARERAFPRIPLPAAGSSGYPIVPGAAAFAATWVALLAFVPVNLSSVSGGEIDPPEHARADNRDTGDRRGPSTPAKAGLRGLPAAVATEGGTPFDDATEHPPRPAGTSTSSVADLSPEGSTSDAGGVTAPEGPPGGHSPTPTPEGSPGESPAPEGSPGESPTPEGSPGESPTPEGSPGASPATGPEASSGEGTVRKRALRPM